MGFSKKQTVAVLYICSAILGVTAVVITTTGLSRALVLLVTLAIAGVLTGRQFLHHRQKEQKAREEQEKSESSED
jgi:UDP-GlcNAc:undecaprenyl-phosphate GlcNAc-1-phosphate transferase